MNRTLRSVLAVLGILTVLLPTSVIFAQARQDLRIPDILGYTTLKCDFHLHTVFSDGQVWPTVRVDEAWREGLDAIAITDHIEYQPHKQDIPTNHNRPYEIALPRARERGILLVKAAEFTRDTPPGHFNALFVDDINPLDTKDLVEAMAAADRQGAFIWWNHPGWKPEHKGWFEIHTTIYEKKYLRGIEVVNGQSYYPEGHEWALEKGLTFLANSDMHGPSPLDKTTSELHRPMTFVFVKEKTVPAIRDALVAGRTAIWFENKVLGRQEYLEALCKAAIRSTDVRREAKVVRFTLRNDSDLPLELKQAGKLGPRELNLPPQTSVRVSINTSAGGKPVQLSYTASNFLIGPEKGLPVRFVVGSDAGADSENKPAEN
ncbi:MAG: Sb-PDE family phosphodiesterase [Planctomycetes bacterium]|jgi:hypothetical protein|nr:Sb-PDE family phosphodiesterase [Planctomycetota bacterium]